MTKCLDGTGEGTLPWGRFSVYIWIVYGYVDGYIQENLYPISTDISTSEISEHQELEMIL